MAAGEVIGCFGLTEPEAGSDAGSMTTTARRDGGGWVIDGAKRWIGLASIAGIAIIWARTDDGVRGFLIPTGTPGFTATPIEPKLAMRASIQCDIALDGIRVPADAILPGAAGLRGPFACLNEARYGIIWGAMGAARDAYEVALGYALERRQFGKPIASFQLTQEKLVDMVLEIQKGLLVALHTGRMKDAGTLVPEQISCGKLNNGPSPASPPSAKGSAPMAFRAGHYWPAGRTRSSWPDLIRPAQGAVCGNRSCAGRLGCGPCSGWSGCCERGEWLAVLGAFLSRVVEQWLGFEGRETRVPGALAIKRVSQ